MPDLFIPLLLTPGIAGIYLRPIRGTEEMNVSGSGTADAVQLLDAMLDQAANPSLKQTASLVTADRDRVLASLYIELYGPRIDSSLSCRHCREKFDLDFSLYSLLVQCAPPPALVKKDGVYATTDGVLFRLPTGDDELIANASQSDPVEALLARCLLDEKEKPDTGNIESIMAGVAPVLNLEMEAVCPECNTSQQVRFDMQSFFLQRIKKERPRLLYEIHRIALAYHWSHDDILTLPRKLRKDYVKLIEAS